MREDALAVAGCCLSRVRVHDSKPSAYLSISIRIGTSPSKHFGPNLPSNHRRLRLSPV